MNPKTIAASSNSVQRLAQEPGVAATCSPIRPAEYPRASPEPPNVCAVLIESLRGKRRAGQPGRGP